MRGAVHIWERAVVTHEALRAHGVVKEDGKCFFFVVFFFVFSLFSLVFPAVFILSGIQRHDKQSLMEWKRFPCRFWKLFGL